jgi:hypothetical protein
MRPVGPHGGDGPQVRSCGQRKGLCQRLARRSFNPGRTPPRKLGHSFSTSITTVTFRGSTWGRRAAGYRFSNRAICLRASSCAVVSSKKSQCFSAGFHFGSWQSMSCASFSAILLGSSRPGRGLAATKDDYGWRPYIYARSREPIVGSCCTHHVHKGLRDGLLAQFSAVAEHTHWPVVTGIASLADISYSS